MDIQPAQRSRCGDPGEIRAVQIAPGQTSAVAHFRSSSYMETLSLNMANQTGASQRQERGVGKTVTVVQYAQAARMRQLRRH